MLSGPVSSNSKEGIFDVEALGSARGVASMDDGGGLVNAETLGWDDPVGWVSVIGEGESTAEEEFVAAGEAPEGGTVANGRESAAGGRLLVGAVGFSEVVFSSFVGVADSLDGGVTFAVTGFTSTHAVAPPMNFFSWSIISTRWQWRPA